MSSKMSIKFVITFFMVFSMIALSCAMSSTALDTTYEINLSNDSYNASYPNVQNVGSNVYVAWSEGSHGIWFKSSTDGGLIWGTAIRLSPTGGVAQFPLMTANGSNVYVTWAQSLNNVLQTYFAVSTKNGTSFAAAKVVDNTPTVTCITPVLASYGSNVYVAYDGGDSSYVVSSTNAGSNFSTPFKYASGPEPQLAAWGSSAYAVADSFSRTALPIYYTNNAGATWLKANSTGGVSAEPWVMASGTNVIVAWETKTNQSDVYLTTSTNSGKTWTAKYLLSATTPDAWAPMLGLYGNIEYVAYRTNPGSSQSQEYASVSLNAGVSWSTPVAIGFAGHDNSWPTQVAVSDAGTTAFVMWYERTGTSSSSPWQAVAQETTNSGTTWLPSPLVLGGSLAESDVATAAISSYGLTMFAVWTNSTSSGRDQVYFATGS